VLVPISQSAVQIPPTIEFAVRNHRFDRRERLQVLGRVLAKHDKRRAGARANATEIGTFQYVGGFPSRNCPDVLDWNPGRRELLHLKVHAVTRRAKGLGAVGADQEWRARLEQPPGFLSVEGMLDASTLTPAARLAKRLLNLVELFGGDDGMIALDISQDDLADLLGTSRQTINRILKEWEERDWIVLRYKRLQILQPRKLRTVRLGDAR